MSPLPFCSGVRAHCGYPRLSVALLVSATFSILAMTRPGCERFAEEPQYPLTSVGLAWQTEAPNDSQVESLVDEALAQVLGPERLRALIRPGDRVVIKVNLVAPNWGAAGQKGLGIITDPRILRHVAAQVREIIGPEGDLAVVDGLFYTDPDPSMTSSSGVYRHSFYWARLERGNTTRPSALDICYDLNHDGTLDGGSGARLVNLDAVGRNDRFVTSVVQPLLGRVDVWLPKMLRTRAQAIAAGEPDTFCDVLIGLPVLKSHVIAGFTGAIKLHYGFRALSGFEGRNGYAGENGRNSHSGTTTPLDGAFLDEYLVAQHRVRTYDLVIMDALVANRRGPQTPDYQEHTPADLVSSHAVLASRNAVAIDTVGTLLAGYQPASVQYLARAHADGLGPANPALIDVVGEESFAAWRSHLRAIFGPLGKYPFYTCYGFWSTEFPWAAPWGGASLHNDFAPPQMATLSPPTPTGGDALAFTYRAEDAESGVARVDLLLDGQRVAWSKGPEGVLVVPTAGLSPGNHEAQLLAWDRTLNCTRSPAQTFAIPRGATFGLW